MTRPVALPRAAMVSATALAVGPTVERAVTASWPTVSGGAAVPCHGSSWFAMA